VLSLTILLMYIYYPIILFNIIIGSCFNHKGDASTSVLPVYIVALPDDGRSYSRNMS